MIERIRHATLLALIANRREYPEESDADVLTWLAIVGDRSVQILLKVPELRLLREGSEADARALMAEIIAAAAK